VIEANRGDHTCNESGDLAVPRTWSVDECSSPEWLA